ncbi:SPOR domain-containing protein [Lentibacillus jeotgali]|uniref:SPOR domain-containing protein n=1 Tax=Lentibacillus jeotgali TaxID=558169 RepID=UPI0002627004|nr:SPOR domain-containing protein [Lentibacillus jeotgali]
MGKNKKVDVWTNGKKTKKNKNAKNNKKHSINESNKEHAAAMENSDVPEYLRYESKDGKKGHSKEIYYNQQSKFKMAKPFFIASISAVIIGAFLGFFMLNMFVDINGNISQQESPSLSAAADEENTDTADAESTDAAAFDAHSAYVVQAGKFSEQANAEEMATAVQDAGLSAMIWENESFYFVLSGISNSEQQAEQTATEFTNNGIEVYVKEWQTEANEITLTDNEKEWLQMYKQQWDESFGSVSSGNHISKDAWSEVIDAVPEDTESISGFIEFVNEQYQAMGQTDKWQDQVILLNMWEQFSQLISQ